MEIPSHTASFIIWMVNNTSSIQSNVRYYKGVHYFIDKKTVSGKDGGLQELYNVYVNEVVGL